MGAKQLATGLAWPEGPAVLPDGRVAFVETYASRIGCWSAADGHQVLTETGGGPNALALGRDGYLYCCQNGGVVGPWRAEVQLAPSIQRIPLDGGPVEVLATELSGVPFQAPNDLAFGPDGRLYFTDPGRYDAAERPDPGYLFAVDRDGAGELLADLGPVYPNGIVAAADGSVIWVESYTGAVRRRQPDGTITEVGVLPDGHVPDGLAVAANGDLYVTSVTSGGLDIVAGDGTPKGFVEIGTVPTNCCFDSGILYVTDGGLQGTTTTASAGGVLWAVDLGVPGLPLFG